MGDWISAANTAPDDEFAAALFQWTRHGKATAENDLCKAVIAGEDGLPAGRAGVNHAPSDKPCK